MAELVAPPDSWDECAVKSRMGWCPSPSYNLTLHTTSNWIHRDNAKHSSHAHCSGVVLNRSQDDPEWSRVTGQCALFSVFCHEVGIIYIYIWDLNGHVKTPHS